MLTKLFGGCFRLIILKGTHKPLIHPPLAPAATQGLFFVQACHFWTVRVTVRFESGRLSKLSTGRVVLSLPHVLVE